MARLEKESKTRDSTANLGFEAKLWLTADKLRNNMDAAECKDVVLGLIFLKYISHTLCKVTFLPERCIAASHNHFQKLDLL